MFEAGKLRLDGLREIPGLALHDSGYSAHGTLKRAM
jgi:hypothetical protein